MTIAFRDEHNLVSIHNWPFPICINWKTPLPFKQYYFAEASA